MERTVMSWSGGKDSALALFRLIESDTELVELWTTIGEETGRSSMHGILAELYEVQAAAIGIPIRLVRLPPSPDNEWYREFVRKELDRYAAQQVDSIAYADLHLEDIKRFREELLAMSELDGRWPVWGIGSLDLMMALIEHGFEATVVAVDTASLDPSFLGQTVDEAFLESLPDGVDVAGEQGEYHTFVTDGPMFDEPVPINHGQIIEREVGETTMAYLDIEHATEPKAKHR